ncbi:MAG TPA: molybdopterin-dependent oxidoreductase [Candidatus Omnitrophota bacterium]|nr:molybdopterin-dependent oxidoreductase [Candidatus Omnitrophota bacterium]
MATVKLKVDGREVEVEKGTNLVDAGKMAGIFMPHFCYHPGLPVVGVCRICLCEIEGRPKLVAGCATPAEEGMNVITKSKAVRDARAAVMEFLLIHHPLDCPMCDKGGECTLQDYTIAMGAAHTRFSFKKNTWPEEDVGGKLILNKNRCILCMRCVNLCADVAGQDEIAVIARGEETYIGTVGGRKIENELAGNIADICPVGALTSVDFRFESRPWELHNVKTICTLCSKGCNTVAGFHPRRNKVLRVTARENMDVNQWWICDRGRGQFHSVHDVVRIATPLYRSRTKGAAARPVAWADAIAQVAGAIKDSIARQGADSVGVVSSAELSNEELFLAGRIFGPDGLGLSNFDFPERPQPPVVYPKFTIEGDKNPNTRGARLLGGTAGKRGRSVKEILTAAAEGRIGVLLFLRGGAPETFGDAALVARALDRAGLVVVMDFVASAVADLADWVLPGVSHFEKDGTYVNSQGRVQRARKVFTLRGDTREDWRLLQDLGSALGVLHETDPSAEMIFARIARTVPAFTGLSYSALGDRGAPLDTEAANVAVG